jgi:hypothetical protein
MATPLFDRVNAVLGRTGQEAGIPDLFLGEDGMCHLTLSDGRRVGFALDEKRSQLWVFAGLFTFPEDKNDRAILYERMLTANLLAVGSVGGLLAMDPVEDTALFQLALGADNLDTAGLTRAMTVVVSRAQSITANLLNLQPATP